MDTVLNIGLNDEVAEGMVNLTGDERFRLRLLPPARPDVRIGRARSRDEPFEEVLAEIRDRSAASTTMPSSTARGLQGDRRRVSRVIAPCRFPDDPIEQLRLATEAVFKSWNGKRAIDYRNAAEHRPRPRYRREHPDDGVRQHG